VPDEIFDDVEHEATKAEEAKRAKQRRRREMDDLRKLLKMAEFKRFAWRFLSATGVFRTPYAPKDSNQTYVNIGVKEVGLTLLADIHAADSSAYATMQREFASDTLLNPKPEGEKNA
jgi:hypothetical protein